MSVSFTRDGRCWERVIGKLSCRKIPGLRNFMTLKFAKKSLLLARSAPKGGGTQTCHAELLHFQSLMQGKALNTFYCAFAQFVAAS